MRAEGNPMCPRRALALALLAVLGVAACSENHWTKPGATVEDFNRDNHACALEAQRGVFSYQACDDHMCYIPQKVPLTWKLHFEPHDTQRAPAAIQHK